MIFLIFSIFDIFEYIMIFSNPDKMYKVNYKVSNYDYAK